MPTAGQKTLELIVILADTSEVEGLQCLDVKLLSKSRPLQPGATETGCTETMN